MLSYLIFDPNEDDQGNVNWDAMASVVAERVPALQADVNLTSAPRHCRAKRRML